MNIFKRLASFFSKETKQDDPHADHSVEEETEDCSSSELFARMLREAGVKNRELEKVNAVAVFEEWYTGPCNEEDILNSLTEFKQLHPAINAKLSGKI